MGNAVKTTVLLAALSGLLLFIGDMMGGRSGLVIALGFAVVMNIGSYWFSDKIVLAMYRAQPVGPDHPLHQIVQRLSQRAGLPMPKVYIIPDASPNAFATGRNPDHAAVAATEGILRLLSEDELAGVVAHELAHVKHRDILISSVAATIAAAIMFAAQMARFAAIFGGGRSLGRSRRRQQPDRAARDDDPGPARGDADPGGDFALARVRRRRRRRGDRRRAARTGERAAQAGDGLEAAAARRQPGDGAHVHHQAVHRPAACSRCSARIRPPSSGSPP